ncbi:MAG TPA: LytTR family transcriptional regulator DNA-binding domain-containing protein, partial [Candidatus Agathobaculum merdavium]|nr:LytTR family transcriptional regulator DNA-binding domain-containing protein [Candidatus Agathobaculum merdavium]
EAQLPSYFLRCHQSYLVNMQQIRKLDTQNHVFLLGNNEEILISRRNYTHAKERYQQFLLEQ